MENQNNESFPEKSNKRGLALQILMLFLTSFLIAVLISKLYYSPIIKNQEQKIAYLQEQINANKEVTELNSQAQILLEEEIEYLRSRLSKIKRGCDCEKIF